MCFTRVQPLQIHHKLATHKISWSGSVLCYCILANPYVELGEVENRARQYLGRSPLDPEGPRTATRQAPEASPSEENGF
jgi:hypothetical protein